MLLLTGVLSISEAAALIITRLGNVICRGLAGFWAMRLLMQFVGYAPALWRRRRFKTGVHLVLTGALELLYARVWRRGLARLS